MTSFVSKGFPDKDHIEELFIIMVYCMYSQHLTLSTYLISIFNCNLLIKGTIQPICAESAIKTPTKRFSS